MCRPGRSHWSRTRGCHGPSVSRSESSAQIWDVNERFNEEPHQLAAVGCLKGQKTSPWCLHRVFCCFLMCFGVEGCLPAPAGIALNACPPFAYPKGITGWGGALISKFMAGLMEKKTQLPSDMGSLFLVCPCLPSETV